MVGDADLDARAWIEPRDDDTATGKIAVEPIWITRDFAVALKDSFSARMAGGEIVTSDFELKIEIEQRTEREQ